MILAAMLRALAGGVWAGVVGAVASVRVWPHLPLGRLVAHNVGLLALPVAAYHWALCPLVARELPASLAFLPWALFVALYALPAVAYLLVDNANNHQRVSDALARLGAARRRPSQVSPSRGPVSDVAASLYRAGVFAVVNVVCVLAGALPVLGPALQLVLSSLVYATFCFEYALRARGASVMQLLQCVEGTWAHMVGFALPLALVSWVLPSFWLAYPVTQVLMVAWLAAAALGDVPVEQHPPLPRLPLRALVDAAALRPIANHLHSKRMQRRQSIDVAEAHPGFSTAPREEG